MGEGCSGRGAQTCSPGGSGGRGSAGTRQLDVRVPFPHHLGTLCACPKGGWGEFRPIGESSPLGIVVPNLRQFVCLAAIGPCFPEAPRPNWGVPRYWLESREGGRVLQSTEFWLGGSSGGAGLGISCVLPTFPLGRALGEAEGVGE